MTSTGVIYCDGACRGNGTRHAIAGWAWAYWPGIAAAEPTHYRAERLTSPPATNQRAELMALMEAIRWWKETRGDLPIKIHTDSMYAINCTTKWGPAWRRKGWTRASGEPLQNLDLIKPLVECWNPAWSIIHVRGHQQGCSPHAWGNNWVDRAAVAASLGEPVVPLSFTPPPASTLRETPAPAPAPVPFVPTVKRPPPPPTRLAVKQSDIRSWFGGGSTD
jgi:ribonuclease HI